MNISYHKFTDNERDTTPIADAWEIARRFSSLQTKTGNSLDKLTESKEDRGANQDFVKYEIIIYFLTNHSSCNSVVRQLLKMHPQAYCWLLKTEKNKCKSQPSSALV